MSDLFIGIAKAFVGGTVGSLGFAWLVHVPRRAWLPGSCIAGLAYLLYWLLARYQVPEPVAVFCGALFGSLLGQLCARRMRLISTIFVTLAIVPIVPGLGLYRMMASLGQGRTAAGAEQGVQAMITIAMIAIGVGVGSYVDRLIWHRPPSRPSA